MPIAPRVATFSSVIAEPRIEASEQPEKFVPDLICEGSDGVVQVEFYFTHAVEEAKRKAAISRGWQMVEIDLASFRDRLLVKEELREFLCDRSVDRKWVAYPPGRRLLLRLKKASAALRNATCPHGICTAGEEPCWECPYRLSDIRDGVQFRCTGTSRVTSLRQLEQFERGEQIPIDYYILRRKEARLQEERQAARRRAFEARRARLKQSALVIVSKNRALEDVLAAIEANKTKRFREAERQVDKQLERIAAMARVRMGIWEAHLAHADGLIKAAHAQRMAYEAKLEANRKKWSAMEDGSYRPHCSICGQKMYLVRGREVSERVYGCPDPSHPKIDHRTAVRRSPPPKSAGEQTDLLPP